MKLNDVLKEEFDLPDRGPAKLSTAEVNALLKARRNPATDWDEVVDMMYDTLFDIFLNAGEMPYGTAKARDGDPVQWMAHRLASMDNLEFSQFIRTNQQYNAPKAKTKNIGA